MGLEGQNGLEKLAGSSIEDVTTHDVTRQRGLGKRVGAEALWSERMTPETKVLLNSFVF